MTSLHTTGSSSITTLLESICGITDNIIPHSPVSSTPDAAIGATASDATPDADFSYPQALTPRLLESSLALAIVEKFSDSEAEELKIASQRVARMKCADLARLPRATDCMPMDQLEHLVHNEHHRIYTTKLAEMANNVVDLVRFHVAALSQDAPSPRAEATSEVKSKKKSKRQFKTEYLPLFEFAFEQDRFPSREDKKHLARLTGMSYRQVSVWFQNRRCRRAKVQRAAAPPPPQTLGEMKARLGAALPCGGAAGSGSGSGSGGAGRGNALEAGRTGSAGVFPAVYAPSPVGADPFVVAHDAWLRDPRARTRARAGEAPSVEDVLDGLHAMEVDDGEAADVVQGGAGRRAKGRTESSGSGWSGCVSRSSSFSTAPSSVLSSPGGGGAGLLPWSECAVRESDSPRADGAWEGGLDGWTAGSKVRVDAWMTELPAGEMGSKWEQLLAAVSVAPAVHGQGHALR